MVVIVNAVFDIAGDAADAMLLTVLIRHEFPLLYNSCEGVCPHDIIIQKSGAAIHGKFLKNQGGDAGYELIYHWRSSLVLGD